MFNIFSRDDSRNQPKDEVTQLPISKIVPNKYQPRNIFNDEEDAAVAVRIRAVTCSFTKENAAAFKLDIGVL